MGTEIFPLRGPQEEREVDTDMMPLNGTELQAAVLADLESLVSRVKVLLSEQADIGRQYAFPRVRWSIQLTVTPYYTDEKPVELELEGGVENPTGEAGEAIAASVEQPPVIDGDRLRPEKVKAPKVHEEASKTMLHPNPMVRMGEK